MKLQNCVFYLSVESVSMESSENSKECTSPKFHSTYQVDDMILDWHQHCCKCYNPEIDPKVEPCCPKDKCDDCLQLEFDDEKGGYDMLCLKKKSKGIWTGNLIKDVGPLGENGVPWGTYVAVTCDKCKGSPGFGNKMEVRYAEYFSHLLLLISILFFMFNAYICDL